MQTTTPTASESINDNNLTATFDFIPQSNNDLTRPSVVTVDFEKPLTDVDLLALKVDKSLMTSLDQWLGKYGIQLPNSLIKTIEQMDLCPEKASEGMRRKCVRDVYVVGRFMVCSGCMDNRSKSTGILPID
jgi:hypothetical protein